MANNSRDDKLHQSAFRPALDRRKSEVGRAANIGKLSLDKSKEVHLTYLKNQLELQVNKPLPNSLEFSRLQQKQLFNTAFLGALRKLKVEEQTDLLNLITGKSTPAMAKLTAAMAVNPVDLIDDGKASIITQMLVNALEGSTGRPGNNSNLLMQFLENHRQQIRPLVTETKHTGIVPNLAQAGKIMDAVSGGKDFSDMHFVARTNFTPSAMSGVFSPGSDKRSAVLASNKRNGFVSSFEELTSKLDLLRMRTEGEIKISDPIYERAVSPHGAGALEGNVGSFDISFNLIDPKASTRAVRIKIPQLTSMETNLPGAGHRKDIGFTGPSLAVRRTFTPFTVMESRETNWTKHAEQGRDEYYMRRIIGEVVDPLIEGKITVRQADKHLKKLRSIINDAEILGGSAYDVQPAQQVMEDIKSGATTIVQPAAAGTVDKDTKVPLIYEELTPKQLTTFASKNPGYGADLAPGKIAAGMLSKVDLAMMQSLAPTLVQRARQDQGIRKTTPSAPALLEAYSDHVSNEKLTKSTGDFEQQQKWVRKQFWKTTAIARVDGNEAAFFQREAERRRNGNVFKQNKKNSPIQYHGGISTRSLISSGGLDYDPTTTTQSTVLETNKSGYRPVKNSDMATRLQSKQDTMSSLVGKIKGTKQYKDTRQTVHQGFHLTESEFDLIAEIAERKNIPVWRLKQMSNEAWKELPESEGSSLEKQEARRQFLSQRGLAKRILEAPDRVEPGRLRRQMLSLSTDAERQLTHGFPTSLPNVIGAQAGSVENIQNTGTRNRTKDLLGVIDSVKKGRHPMISGGTAAEQKQMLSSFLEKQGSLLSWLGQNFSNEEINYAYHNLAMKKDIGGLGMLKGFVSSPLSAAAGDDAFTKMNKLLAEGEGILNAGTYYVDKQNFLDNTTKSIPFGKGGALNSPDLRRMSSYDLGGTLKLSWVNNRDLFSVDKDGNFSLNTDYINERDSGRGVFIGLDNNGNPKYLSKKMINSNEFTATNVRFVGTSLEDAVAHIEYRQTHQVQELSKTQGDSKEGGAYAKTRKDYDDAVRGIADIHGNERGARVLRESRFQSDKVTFTEMFEKGKRPQLHNRQMLTALAAHQMSHMKSFAIETTDMGLNQGNHWMGRYAQQMVSNTVLISEPQGTGTGPRMVGSSMLLENMDKFRATLQEGVGNITMPVDDLGQVKWDKTWDPGHREGTKKLMEWYFKQGITMQEIMQKGSAGSGYRVNPLLQDKARNWLHIDYFSEIFGATGTHFGAEESDKIVQEVMEMELDSGRTIGTALNNLLTGTEHESDWSLTKTQRFKDAAKTGTVFGAARINWGDPMSQQGAGKMGTIEPRFLDILSGPQAGLHGEEIRNELLAHIRHQDATAAGDGKFAIHQETEKMLQSLAGNLAPGKDDVVVKADLDTMSPSEIMEKIQRAGKQISLDDNGQNLFLEVGNEKIYMPPTDMPGMRKHTIEEAGGRLIPAQAQIAGHIEEYLHSVGEVGPEDARRGLITSVAEDWAMEGKGMGAVTRSRVPGSMMLTAAKTNTLAKDGIEAIDDMFRIEIPRKQAETMLKDLERTGMHDAAELEEMKFRLLGGKKGDTVHASQDIAGWMLRHPGIGPLSYQKVMIGIAEGAKDPTVFVPEVDFHMNLDILDEANSNLDQGIRKFNPHVDKKTKEKIMTKFTFGPTVGMAMDFDFDTPVVGFYGPQLEGKVREELDSRHMPAGAKGSKLAQLQEYTQRSVEHQIRFQLLKEGDPEKGISVSELRAAGLVGDMAPEAQIALGHVGAAEKLSIASSNIGKISSQLTTAKRAALSGNLAANDLAAINTLAEWIEQKPIGFKHVDPEVIRKRIGALSTGFDTMSEESLRIGIGEFLGEDALQMLSQKKVQLSSGNAKTFSEMSGVTVPEELRGIDIDRTIRVWAKSQRDYSEAERIAQNVHRGKGGPDAILKELKKMHVEQGGGTPKNVVGRIIENAEQVASNIAGASGRSMVMDHKGIAALVAVGGLAALANMSSQPREMVGPGRHLNANAKPHMNSRKAHKRMTPNDVRPMKAPLGNPTGPNLLSQRRAMIASNPIPRDKFAVTARANHPDDISVISQQFQGFAVNGGYVSMNNSSRGISNPYGEINKQY